MTTRCASGCSGLSNPSCSQRSGAAAGPRERADQLLQGIAGYRDDPDILAIGPCGNQGRLPWGKEDIDVEARKLGDEVLQLVAVSVRETRLDDQVPPLLVAEPAQLVSKRLHPRIRGNRRRQHDKSNAAQRLHRPRQPSRNMSSGS